jgi:crotonobetainyl-CoA:carnitine CoA-transferase CaiB-like acyl-CoA transferase
MQAESGLMDLTGEPDGPPSRIGAPSMVDQSTGLTAAVGLLSGVIRARSTGEGCDIDISLFDVALHQLGYVACWYLNNGHTSTRQPRSAHFSLSPVQTFPTQDGWLFVMCMSQKFFEQLVVAMNRVDLREDSRFSTNAARQANREALTDILDEEFRKRPNGYWMRTLAGNVPVAPVLDLAQALDNPFLDETGMIGDLPHPVRPELRGLSNPIKVDGQRLPRAAGSQMGADNHELFSASNDDRDAAAQ